MSPLDWFITSMLCFVLRFLLSTIHEAYRTDSDPIVDSAVETVLHLLLFGCIGSLCMWFGSMFPGNIV